MAAKTTTFLTFLVIALSIALPNFAIAGPYSDAVAADNPVAWWRMDDASDVYGHTLLSADPGITFDQTGAILSESGYAAAFPGTTGGTINVDDAADLNYSYDLDFTIEAWVKRSEAAGTRDCVINKGDTNGSFWLLWESDGSFRVNLDYGSTSAGTIQTETTYDDGAWHHVAVSVDRTANLHILVDGTLAYEKRIGPEGGSVSSEGMMMQIGAMNSNFYYNGSMDEFAVYDYAIGADAITAHYNAATGASTDTYSTLVSNDAPIGWWRMDSEADQTGNHFSFSGMDITYSTTGAIAGDSSMAATFAGTEEGVILVDDSADLNFGEDQDFSIETWIQRPAAAGTRDCIVNKGDTNGSFWLLWEDDGTIRLNLDYGDTGTGLRTTESYDDGAWHQVVLSADRDDMVQIYVDGALAVEGAVDDLLESNSVSSEGLPVNIGALGTALPFSGSMDELAIYDSALTDEQILAHYDAAYVITPDVPGDANKDGKVDGSDVTILAGNWQVGVGGVGGATWEMGDFNGDGAVDGSDVTILAGNWQYGVTTVAAGVPEPSTMILLLTALAMLIARRVK